MTSVRLIQSTIKKLKKKINKEVVNMYEVLDNVCKTYGRVVQTSMDEPIGNFLKPFKDLAPYCESKLGQLNIFH